jgi:glycosyltransferase involved in cell wall biosynthesis
MSSGISLVIPHIPTRHELFLQTTLPSVVQQTLQPDVVLVITDNDKEGAGAMRNRGIALADTEWVAFLDDDDELYPDHLAVCCNHAFESGADVVWPWYDCSSDPLPPDFFGRQWDPLQPHSFPITALVRTEVARMAVFPPPAHAGFGGEDWSYWLQLSSHGVKFSHVAQRTWRYNHHGTNTSGAPGRW